MVDVGEDVVVREDVLEGVVDGEDVLEGVLVCVYEGEDVIEDDEEAADVGEDVVDGETKKAGATPRKSVFAGACAIGVNTAVAEEGDAPGMNCSTTLPPAAAVPGPVHMYSMYCEVSGSTNPVIARAVTLVAPTIPLAPLYDGLSGAVQPVGRA